MGDLAGISASVGFPGRLAGQFGAKLTGTTADTVRETAREFEATLIASLLKEMRQTLEPDGLFPGDSGDVQGGLFDLYLSRHLADAGGVGLAAAVVAQVRHAEPKGLPDGLRRTSEPPGDRHPAGQAGR